MKNLVVLTGAGMSAESGIRTFREMGGLWEEYDVMEVASPQGWENNMELVLRFYNQRRKQLLSCKPNKGHFNLVELENSFNVNIITQNVDDLHERAVSSDVIHLHGELKKARSTIDESLIYNINGWEIKKGDKCEKGSQLRPDVVWFGEAVPAIEKASEICLTADVFVVVGTSLNVYPAAGLLDFVPRNTPIFLIDPNEVNSPNRNLTFIKEKAGVGISILIDMLKKRFLK
ncbi:MAG: NAD-dependent deacylase [Bacteroidales bacterium]|jgi:NAD-dependent deacetylase|nr:NAD-dependent deacylase [Bacteroidales bacterium]